MSIIAGIISKDRATTVLQDISDQLELVLSRNPADPITRFRTPAAFLLKTDFGCYGAPAFCSEGSVAMLAGDPVFRDRGPDRTRATDLCRIKDAFDRNQQDVLLNATGAYCAAYYDPARHVLALVADKLAIRQLYYYEDQDFVVFASALRIMEELTHVPKRMDVNSVMQISSLGYPLGDRTPYADIRLLDAGKIAIFEGNQLRTSSYWTWNDNGQSEKAGVEEHVYSQITDAISRRLGNQTHALSLLSGGLDSRCVVAELTKHCGTIDAFNFYLPNYQDGIFAHDFAKLTGIRFHALKRTSELWTHTDLLRYSLDVWSGDKNKPFVVWSGEGGSVAFGHVHITSEIVTQMRAGRARDAIRTYVRTEMYRIPKTVRQQSAVSNDEMLLEGILQQLTLICCEDKARSFYAYLLLNDQKRHLHGFYEDLDQHRIEFHLPLFDSDLIATIASTPIDLCVGHGLYNRVMKLAPASVTAVPWQSYPGHEPSPVQVPAGLDYQWNREFQQRIRAQQKPSRLRRAQALLAGDDLPTEIFNCSAFRAAYWLYRFGIRDYSYLVDVAETFAKYSRICLRSATYITNAISPLSQALPVLEARAEGSRG